MINILIQLWSDGKQIKSSNESAMTDVLTPEQRKRCMSNIQGKDTKPEMIVRRMVHTMGYRYRLHHKDLPGKPDLVLVRHKKIIFVNGCFWHKHNCRYGRVKPKTNVEFWEKKRNSTVERDRRNRRILRKDGWKILIVWECWTKDTMKLEKRLCDFLK